MDSAAISSSRMEMQALPWEDRIKLFIRTTDAAVNIKSQVQFVNRGIPFNPAAPLVISKLRNITRMISAMPRVAMAR